MRINIVAISLALLLPVVTIFSQNLDFRRIKVEEGLPHSTVNNIAQDQLGFIWIATDDGLARYDNYEFNVYNNVNEKIANNQVNCVYIDNEEKLWIGTKSSLAYYNHEKDSFIDRNIINMPYNEEVPVIDIVQMTDSTYLIGTDGGGLRVFYQHLDTNKYVLPPSENNKMGNRVSSIYQDENDRYWIATLDKGLFVCNPELTKIIKNIPFYLGNGNISEVRSLIPLDPQHVLVGTYGVGAFRININTFDHDRFHYAQSPNSQSQRIYDMVKQDSMVYVGTDGAGLYRVNLAGNEIRQYNYFGCELKSIANDVIKTIFIDREENIWLGHYQGGISLSKKKKAFRHISYSLASTFSLSHTNVSSIIKDNHDRLWIGTDGGGLNIIHRNTMYNEPNNNLGTHIANSLNPQNILAMYQDSRDLIWVGTYLNGVYVYNPETKLLLPLEEMYSDIELNNSDIRCFYEDRNGYMWIGTNGGGINIVDIENETVRYMMRDNQDLENSLSLDWIRVIMEDSYGFIWIGTAYGLNAYDPVNESFTHYLHKPGDTTSLTDNFIYSIMEDKQNNMWVGTSSGLNKYVKKTGGFKRYYAKNGLPNNTINAMLEDQSGYIWISTNNGLSKFNAKKDTFRNFEISDGLISNTFVNGASYRQENGELYFGTIDGLVYFEPDQIEGSVTEVPVVFTDFKIHNHKISTNATYNNRVVLNNQISYTKSIELFKKENVITINFSALTFSYPEKVNYAYKLEGFKDDWIVLKNGNSVTYTNLEPGEYAFHVRVNNIGEKQPMSTLKLTVLPPFYETWYFRVVMILMVLFLIFMIIRARINKIKIQKKQLEEKYKLKKMQAEQERTKYENLKLESDMKRKEADMNYKNSQLISSTLLITHKNEIMNEVKSKIIAFSKDVINPEVKSGISNLVKTIDSEFKLEDDWKRFETHFNQVHKDFFKRLKDKYPDLSLTYLRLSAYLRLDLSTKEIASLMNISHRGVEKSRSRLRKKFGIPQDESLVHFISKI